MALKQRASSVGPSEGTTSKPARAAPASASPLAALVHAVGAQTLFVGALLFLGWLTYFIFHEQHQQQPQHVHVTHAHHEHRPSPPQSLFGSHSDTDEMVYAAAVLAVCAITYYIVTRVMEALMLVAEFMACASFLALTIWVIRSVNVHTIPFLPPLVIGVAKLVLLAISCGWCVFFCALCIALALRCALVLHCASCAPPLAGLLSRQSPTAHLTATPCAPLSPHLRHCCLICRAYSLQHKLHSILKGRIFSRR